MLDDLVQTIEVLRERVSRYSSDLSKNEIRTRAVLIDPMLKALGWDVADPAAVTVEFEVPPGRADYGLRRGLDNAPAVLIEAKKLNEPLDPHIGQLLNYALVRGVRYGCLTDGNVWKVYHVFLEAPLEEKEILNVTISDGNSAKIALVMLGLWRANLEDGSSGRPVEPFIDIAPPPPPPPPPPPTGWTPLTGTFGTTKAPSPSAIRLPDGSEIALKAWRGVLIETALWLNRSSLLTKENCQIRLGSAPHLASVSTRYLFSRDGLHADAGKFKSPVKLGDTGIIMEGNLSSKDIVKLAQKLLLQFDQDPSKVLLRLP